MELSGPLSSVARVRGFVRARLAEHLLAHVTEDVELVATELVTNALVHAQTPLRVSLQGFEQTLLLEVEDGSECAPIRVVSPGLTAGGRGLAIVHALSRDWGVFSLPQGGKSVWAEFAVHRHESAALLRRQADPC
jgi:anti-sigma regulatory factor (Ser/Thr protein kinase)